MDDELLALEAELQQLRPAAPSPGLVARVAAQVAVRRPARRTRAWWAAVPLAAAAALALVLLSPRRASAPAADGASSPAVLAAAGAFDPIAAENVLVESRDEGVVTLADGVPARQFREVYVDTITWRNPRTNASLRWTLPREEVRVLPISYQ